MCVCVQDVQTALTPRGMCSCSGAKKVGDFGSPRGAESPCSLGIQQRSVCLLNFMVTGVRRRGWRRERIGARRAGAPARLSAAPSASAECLALTRVNTGRHTTTPLRHWCQSTTPRQSTDSTHLRHLSETLSHKTLQGSTLPASPRGSPKGYRSGVPRLSSSPVRGCAPRARRRQIRTGAQSTEHISTHRTALGLARARR